MRPRGLHLLALGVAFCGCDGATIDLGTVVDSGPLDAAIDSPGSLLVTDDAGIDGGCAIGQVGWLVFDSDRDSFKRDIFAIRSDGTGVTRLTNDPALEEEPSLAPDGLRLAYVSDAAGTSGETQIFVLDLETRQAVQVTSHGGGADEPRWSPDGTLIAFHGGDTNTGAVYTIHADGTDETLVMIDPALTSDAGAVGVFSYEYPAFTVDGGQLIADRANQIQIANLDGTGARLLIPNGAYVAQMPATSLDGHLLAFIGGCGLTVTTLADPQYCLEVVVASAAHPSFGPGNVLAFDQGTSAPGEIMVTTSGCASPFNVTQNPADDRNPKWAPASFTGVMGVPPP